MFSCDDAEELLDGAGVSISGIYTITDVMMYPNSDCSGTPTSGVCASADSITVEIDCPDSGWVSYMSEFDGWSIVFSDDNETVTLYDGMETDTLTYNINANTLEISDSDNTTETITITLASDNSTLDANLNTEPSCSITGDQNGVYSTEELCVDAGFDWDPAQCIGLILTLADTNDGDDEDENDDDDGPPACIEDCPNFELMEADCDGEDCDTADADCVIIASWEGDDCLADCTGDDAEEVNMVIGACADCIADDDIDCEEALDEIYDEDDDYNNDIDCYLYTLIDECIEMDGCHYIEEFDADGNAINGWCENDHDAPPTCIEDCPSFNLLDDNCEDGECDANADCAIIASWADNACLSDCTGYDAVEVNMVIGACADCIANETDCEEALDDND